MSSTSQKHKNFVSEPMGEKPVTDLAGIGEVLGRRLEAKGFDKVKYIAIIIFTYFFKWVMDVYYQIFETSVSNSQDRTQKANLFSILKLKLGCLPLL